MKWWRWSWWWWSWWRWSWWCEQVHLFNLRRELACRRQTRIWSSRSNEKSNIGKINIAFSLFSKPKKFFWQYWNCFVPQKYWPSVRLKKNSNNHIKVKTNSFAIKVAWILGWWVVVVNSNIAQKLFWFNYKDSRHSGTCLHHIEKIKVFTFLFENRS